jgi:hypothetical protein
LAGKNPSEAVANFIGPIQRAIACVTKTVVVRSHDSTEPGGVRAILAPKSDFAQLRGDRRLHLSVAMEYEIIKVKDPPKLGPWKVKTRQYRYHVVTDDLAEVILFHWLPDGNCSTTKPHIHLGGSQLTSDAVITRKTHIPSGRVSLESVIQVLISEFNVVPLRADWQDVLDKGHERTEPGASQSRIDPVGRRDVGPFALA